MFLGQNSNSYARIPEGRTGQPCIEGSGTARHGSGTLLADLLNNHSHGVAIEPLPFLRKYLDFHRYRITESR